MLETSKVKFTKELDENKVPEKLFWEARDVQIINEPTKAVLISVWDVRKEETIKMNLWTKDMSMREIQYFFHQTLLSMSDTYFKATQDEPMTASMPEFCDLFADKIEL